MLYIISGSSRSGKSLVAKKLLNERNLPYFPIDSLVMGFTNGAKEFGIHDKLFPNEIAEKLWPVLKAMCENMIWVNEDYVLEGEALLPSQIKELITLYPNKIRACFIGYTNIEIDKKVSEVKTFSKGDNDWLCNESDEYIYNHINNMIDYSNMVKKECEIFGVKYLDTSYNFQNVLSDIVHYLIEQKE